MNCRSRVLTTLDHAEPDKVPYYEHVIQQPSLASKLGLGQIGGEVRLDLKNLVSFLANMKGLTNLTNRYLPKLSHYSKIIKPLSRLFANEYFKLFVKLKVDLTVFMLGPFSYFKFIKPNYLISGFGQVFELKTISGVASIYYKSGFLNSKEAYERFPKLDPVEPLGTQLYRQVLKAIKKEDIYVIPGIFTGLFDSTYMGFGIELFSKYLIKEPGFIQKVVKDKEKFYIEYIKHAIDEFNLEAFFIGDDLAYNANPFISSRHFNKIFLPSYKNIARMMHKRGVKLIFHSDGNILPLMEGLIEFTDFIHPWQVSANIDIKEIKKKYGDKISLAGNVPIPLLAHASYTEISDYVKDLLKHCAPGGGYFLSSGNSITPEIPWQNYLTMLRTFWKYRNYPITL